jgi:type I restriction-modification system DNA methylase subunit
MQHPPEFRTNRDLFSNHYLDEHLPEMDHWQSIDSTTLRDAYDAINELWECERDFVTDYNESQLEEAFIRPMLQLLNIPFASGESVQGQRPDYGFFQSDEAARNARIRRQDDFYENAVAIADARRWDRPLDTQGENDFENPSYQIHSYLRELPTTWAVLTNGRYWRLYYGSTRNRIDSYYEIDLPTVLESGDCESFKYFYLFFRHEAVLSGAGGGCFLDDVYSESNRFAQELSEDLQENVYEAIKTLADGFLSHPDNDLTSEELECIYDSSIIYLYRLICVLYAESEGCNFLAGEMYAVNSLHTLKQEVAEECETDQSDHCCQDDLWDRIDELFQRIDQWSDSYEIPNPDRERKTQFLATHRVSDKYLARVIELLTRRREGSETVFIDYSSLDVRHLGSIYEELLEYELNVADRSLSFEEGEYVVADGNDAVLEPGEVYLPTNSGERKATGSYYTPEYVVEYIVENTLDPLVDDIREDVIGSDEAFAQCIFELNVVDPAMGSGHFLIRTVEYLAREIIDAQTRQSKRQSDEKINQEYDINWARQQVAKHCIYGVDRNPLAVDLAKVSLWLRTLTSEQPPAFLDHHLKTGNALVGSDIEEINEIERKGDEIERNKLEAIANIHTAEGCGLDDLPADAYEQMAAAVEDEDAWETIEGTQWFQDAQQWADEDDYFHWQLEFPEIFDDETGFDAVIGNPPYIRIQNSKKTDSATVSYLEDTYETTHQNYDLTVPFTELGYELLREDGRFGYIETKKWIQGEYGEKLREYLAEYRAIHELVDFGDQQVFPGASTYTALLFLQKSRTDEFHYANIQDLDGDIDQLRRIQAEDQFVSNDMYAYQESVETIGTAPWVFTLPREREILNTIEQHPTLESIVDTIFVGLQTSADPVYIVDVQEEKSEELRVYSTALDRTLTIEKGVTKPVLRGKDIEKWAVTEHNHRVIFPYRTDSEAGTYNLLSEQTMRQKFPNTWKYLNKNKSRLLERADVNEAAWWGYPYPKNLEKFTAEKLMTQVLANQSSLAIDRDGEFAFVGGGNAGGYGIAVKDDTIQYEALLALLNSTLLEWTVKKESSQFQGGYYSYAKRYIEKVPICLDEMDGEIEDIGRTNRTGTVEDVLADLSTTVIDAVKQRQGINTRLPDYLGSYNWGTSLGALSGYQPAPEVGDSVLVKTTEARDNLRINAVDMTRTGETMVIKASARYKPETDVENCDTDQWGYTETDPIPAIELAGLTERECVLVEEFVPFAVNEASGFANVYERATVTNSLIDRLKALTLPALDDVSKQLEKYRHSKDRARELEREINELEDTIDSVVYEIYDVNREQQNTIESALINNI